MAKDAGSIAVVGAGAWGMNHVRTWQKIGALSVVCDPDQQNLDKARQAAPNVNMTASFESVLSDPSVEGVVLATPAESHMSLALQVIAAGKDVLIEKPLALEVGDGRRIVEAAAASDRIAMVGHVLEYHPAVQELSAMIKCGALGQVRYLYSNRLNFGRIRTHENSLWSFAPHDISLMLRMVGKNPVLVSARGGSYVSRGVSDTSIMSLGFDGGVEAHIFVSWLHPFKEQRFVVVGSSAMAVFDDTKPWNEKLSIYHHDISWLEGQNPVAAGKDPTFVELSEKMPLEQECLAFLSAIETRKTPLADVESGLDVLTILDAGSRSMAADGEPQRIGDLVTQESESYFAHPSSFIDEGARIGAGSKVWHNVHVSSGALVGEGCVLGQNVFVASTAKIGNGCRVQNNVSIYDGVELGHNVFCGPSMVFTNVVNPRAGYDRKHEYARTVVGDGATIGANATIVCGNTIGAHSLIGAGAVVTSDVPSHALMLGLPAKMTGWVSHAGRVLEFDESGTATCAESGYVYRVLDEGLSIVAEIGELEVIG